MKPASTTTVQRAGTTSLLRTVLSLLLSLLATAVWAQDDPPGRVGRVADLNGGVAWWDHEAGQWADADRNLPLTSGDRIATAADGRAELRVGTTVLRLAAGTELEVLRLDDEQLRFQLHTGSVALRVRSREVAAEIELLTAEARLRPQTAGHYRLDRTDDDTWATSWRGELRIDDPAGFTLVANQRVRLQRDGRSGVLRFALGPLQDDAFGQAALRDDQRDERTASSRYVSPEMTGAEDLDRSGRWEQHPEYGAVWVPLDVAADWAPYRSGRWAWVRPWGWTWVDNARWGFAPFHYGRWAYWRDRWCWAPGAYVARPVFAPALVAWVGGAGLGVSLQVGGGGPVGWVPLAPREAYAPHYRVSPRYVERINVPPPYRWQHPPGQRPAGPVVYGNQGVAGAVTVVPREVLLRREPVARAAVDLRDGRRLRGERNDGSDRAGPGRGGQRGPDGPGGPAGPGGPGGAQGLQGQGPQGPRGQTVPQMQQVPPTESTALTAVAPPPAPVGGTPAQSRWRDMQRPGDGGGRMADPRQRPSTPVPSAVAPAAPVQAPPAPVAGPAAALPAVSPVSVPPAQPVAPPTGVVRTPPAPVAGSPAPLGPGPTPVAPGAAVPRPPFDRDAGPGQRRRDGPDGANDANPRRERQRPAQATAQPPPQVPAAPAAVAAPAAQPPVATVAPGAAPAAPLAAPPAIAPRQQPPPAPQRPAPAAVTPLPTPTPPAPVVAAPVVAAPVAAPVRAPAPVPAPAPAPAAAPRPVAAPAATPPPAAPRAEAAERQRDAGRNDERRQRPEAPNRREREN